MPALWCLGVISGAGGVPQRLDFSGVCAARVPIAPAVGAVLPYVCLVPWWHRVRRDACVVSWFKLMGPIGIVLSARHTSTACPQAQALSTGVVSWLDACTAAWLGGVLFVAHAALLACAGGLAFLVCVCLWWFLALVFHCLCMPNHHVPL